MVDDFENHCWSDLIPKDVLDVYSHYKREVRVGQNPALLAIDLYELAYEGGALPPSSLHSRFPSSCGMYAFAAIEPTKNLFRAARQHDIPIFYSTRDTREDSQPKEVRPTKRKMAARDLELFRIRPEFAPQPGDVVLTKQRASVFFGTPLIAHLNLLGVRTIVICGESTSGCVRATAVDAYSYGFHVVVVEDCCFDRSIISHKVNLFDLHHKYADVMLSSIVVQQFGENVPPRRIS